MDTQPRRLLGDPRRGPMPPEPDTAFPGTQRVHDDLGGRDVERRIGRPTEPWHGAVPQRERGGGDGEQAFRGMRDAERLVGVEAPVTDGQVCVRHVVQKRDDLIFVHIRQSL